MNKGITRKFISILVIALFLVETILPLQVFAGIATGGAQSTPTSQTSAPLNYDNPNSGDNPFKPKIKDFINPRLLTQVVGCTGIVSKVAVGVTEFVKEIANNVKAKAALKGAINKAKQNSVPEAPTVGLSEAQKAEQEKTRRDKEKAFTENCLTGIAISLAKNQLTAMTKYTMNWVTTGFNGDPLYVRDVNSYVDSITTEILKKEVNLFKDPANANKYPYGREFAQGAITSKKTSIDFQKTMTQNLTAYLEPGSSINDFSKDFSKGDGWNGWYGLIQDQNNPLGFNIEQSENLTEQQTTAEETAKAEIARSGGVLDQKKCVEPKNYDAASTDPTKNKCTKYETITPGSVIKAKIDTYINSPERQIELAKTLNDALNSLFAALINKFENQGLSGLGSKVNNYTGSSGGFGSNSIVDSLGNTVSSLSNFDNTGSTANSNINESFDLTRDLGNKYADATNTGSWDADTNTPELIPGIGTKNQYYVVSTAGYTKIFAGATHHWTVGEKVFFDGTTWKVGVPKHIINTRGVFQIQKDYLKSISKTVEVLPKVIPKLGELDYCIPGPNQNWQNNSDDAKTAYSSYLSGVSIDDVQYRIDARDYGCFAITCGIINHDYTVINLPDPSEYKKIFDDARHLWDKIVPQEFFYIIHPYHTSWTFGHNEWVVNREVAEPALAKWVNLSTKSYDEYVTKARARYGVGSSMLSEFTDNGDFNPQFLPMAQAGLDLTKNIVTDAIDLPDAISTAEGNFTQTTAAVYKLGTIKNKVNVIIAAAQKRRKDKRVAAGLTDFPQICLDNEKVTYIEGGVLKY